VIYIYAFESLSEDLKKIILTLDPEVEGYLDNQEVLDFVGKNSLTKEVKERLNKEWLKALNRTKQIIQELIDKGELEITDNKITGKSLYNLKGDFAFAEDYKKQVKAYKELAYLILFLKKSRFIEDYNTLLAFKELYKKLSEIYEIDLTYKINKWIKKLDEIKEQLNLYMAKIMDKIEGAVYLKHNITYPLETFIKNMLTEFNKGETEIESINRYYEEFTKLFGKEFIRSLSSERY